MLAAPNASFSCPVMSVLCPFRFPRQSQKWMDQSVMHELPEVPSKRLGSHVARTVRGQASQTISVHDSPPPKTHGVRRGLGVVKGAKSDPIQNWFLRSLLTLESKGSSRQR